MLRRAEGKERLTSVEVSYEISILRPGMLDIAKRLLAVMAYAPDGIQHEELENIFPVDSHVAAAELRKAGLAFDESNRFRVLAPLREHVREKHPPLPADLKRLVDFYVNLAVAEGSKVGGKGGSGAIRRIAPQVANIESSLLQAFQSSDSAPAIRGALALVDFTRLTGIGSSQALEKAALAAHNLDKPQTEADCIRGLGDVALGRANYRDGSSALRGGAAALPPGG